MNIAQISLADRRGGAEQVAWNLFAAYRQAGHRSHLIVGSKVTDDPDVIVLSHDEYRTAWARWWTRGANAVPAGRGRRLIERLGEPRRVLNLIRRRHDFDHPGTRHLLELLPVKPDVIHCHNLHGDYFDLRELPMLCRQAPVVVTMHDAWLLRGYSAHALRDPASEPASAADNLRRKQEIYARCRLYLAAPSRWLLDQVGSSVLAPAVAESRLIPHGIDLSVFRPADKRTARSALGITPDARLLLFAAQHPRRNKSKDFATMCKAIAQAADHLPDQRIQFLVIGEEAPPERLGRAELIFVPFQSAPEAMARYYQAADLYVHATHAEAWGLTITEALACGTPVVATAVGGIPDQLTDATGVLVPPADAPAMAVALETLLADEPRRRRLGEHAAREARQRFDLHRQVADYLNWYRQILAAESPATLANSSRRP